MKDWFLAALAASAELARDEFDKILLCALFVYLAAHGANTETVTGALLALVTGNALKKGGGPPVSPA